jgi:hypothetical protein
VPSTARRNNPIACPLSPGGSVAKIVQLVKKEWILPSNKGKHVKGVPVFSLEAFGYAAITRSFLMSFIIVATEPIVEQVQSRDSLKPVCLGGLQGSGWYHLSHSVGATLSPVLAR